MNQAVVSLINREEQLEKQKTVDFIILPPLDSPNSEKTKASLHLKFKRGNIQQKPSMINQHGKSKENWWLNFSFLLNFESFLRIERSLFNFFASPINPQSQNSIRFLALIIILVAMIIEEKLLEKKKDKQLTLFKPVQPMISEQWVKESPDIQLIESPIPLSTLEKQITGIRDMTKEFKLVKRLTETALHKEMLVEYDVVTIKLNRYQNIIPCKPAFCGSFE